MTATIHHVITFDASPRQLYDELTDAANFAVFTGAPAEIDATPGGAFSLFGGQIEGRNVELVSEERVVQAWRVAAWEPGLYTLVRFEIKKEGPGTTVIFDHTGFPPDAHGDLDAGWHSMYWEPMRKHLATG